MIHETITFNFENEEQQRRFHERLKEEAAWSCGARKQGTSGGNDPADCNWPVCGCDPYATKVIEALDESGMLKGQHLHVVK